MNITVKPYGTTFASILRKCSDRNSAHTTEIPPKKISHQLDPPPDPPKSAIELAIPSIQPTDYNSHDVCGPWNRTVTKWTQTAFYTPNDSGSSSQHLGCSSGANNPLRSSGLICLADSTTSLDAGSGSFQSKQITDDKPLDVLHLSLEDRLRIAVARGRPLAAEFKNCMECDGGYFLVPTSIERCNKQLNIIICNKDRADCTKRLCKNAHSNCARWELAHKITTSYNVSVNRDHCTWNPVEDLIYCIIPNCNKLDCRYNHFLEEWERAFYKIEGKHKNVIGDPKRLSLRDRREIAKMFDPNLFGSNGGFPESLISDLRTGRRALRQNIKVKNVSGNRQR